MIISRKGFIPPSGKFRSGLNCSPVAVGWHDTRGAEANADNGCLPREIDGNVTRSAGIPESGVELRRSHLISRVNPEHFHEVGDFAQVAECVSGGLVVTAKEIDVEHIFPGTAAHGARFDFAQADVAQGEDAEGFEERSRDVFYLE